MIYHMMMTIKMEMHVMNQEDDNDDDVDEEEENIDEQSCAWLGKCVHFHLNNQINIYQKIVDADTLSLSLR